MSLASTPTGTGSHLLLPPPAERLSTLPLGEPQFTLGYEAVAWAHTWLIQPNGPRAGKPFRCTLDQFRFLLWFYALDELTRWLFMHAVRRLAKGSGKSPFAAVVALIEFLAPVRFDHFDPNVIGGVVGRPVDMPLVQIAATTESQTANTMRMVRAFAPKGSAVVEAYLLDPGKTRYYMLPEGTLEVITSSATSAEGAEATFIVADETEHSTPSNGGPDLINTLADNLAKSGNRMMETANAWIPGVDSVAEAAWDAWVAQEEGRTRDEGSILYDARMAPPDCDMTDPESLRAALEWVYGDCEWKFYAGTETPDVEAIIRRIYRIDSRPDDSQRKYLNRPAVATDAWCEPEHWLLLADHDRQVDPAEEVVAFFDGSKSGDATALVGCCLSDGHRFVIGLWEPEDGEVVDVLSVELAVERLFGLNVVAFFGDVREWESFVKVSWPERYADRLEVMAVPTGKDPQAIAWDMRSRNYEFTQACELVEQEILASVELLAKGERPLFTHDGHPGLYRHVKNARRRPNRYGVSIGKESPKSPKKIDAAVCMIGAGMVRNIAAKADRADKRSGVVG